MDIEKTLHMKEGTGPSSYAKNSLMQRTMLTKARPTLEKNIREVYHALVPECLMIADMGCSSGPNTMFILSGMIDIINEASRSLNRPVPEFGVFLNDLPGNDFNSLFRSLPSLYKKIEEENNGLSNCFVSGTPGSFYGRLFPAQSLHFVHSSYSIHWLSKVPNGLKTDNGEALNKKNIYIARTSPPEVAKAYYAQFKRDFTLFLRYREREMVVGGGMVLTFQGSRKSDDPDSIFELLGSTLHTMALEGVVEDEKLESFNFPFYGPSVSEVRNLIEAEGSFSLDRIETFTVPWSGETSQIETVDKRAEFTARSIRVVTESLLANAFGFDEEVMDDVFLRFKTKVEERMASETTEYLNITVSLTKIA